MAIFGNKKKSVIERLDELLNEIDSLPEDEQEKVWAHFDDAKEEMEDDSAEIIPYQTTKAPEGAFEIIYQRCSFCLRVLA